MRHLTSVLACGLALLLAQAAAGPADAQLQPGVHTDPGSPASKQYALPLAQARSTGGSRTHHSSRARQTGGATPNRPDAGLFGQGIKSAQSAAPAQPAAHRAPTPRRAKRSGSHTRATHAPPPPSLPVPGRISSSGSGTAAGVLLGGGLLVLLVAGAVGLALRRQRYSPSSGR